MDDVIVYLYDSLKNDIYMKIPEGLICPIRKILKRIIQWNWTSFFID